MIVNPSAAWKEIEAEDEKVDVQTMYVYPLIGLCGLVAFLASFFSDLGGELAQYDIFRKAIINACLAVIPLFIIYMVSVYSISSLLKSLFGINCRMQMSHKIVGYSMTVMFVSYTLLSFPVDFKILLWLAQVYTMFIIWEGSGRLFKLEDNKRLIFTFFLFSILVLGSGLLYFIFYKLI